MRIYAQAGKKFGLADAKLPLAESRVRSSLSPEGMIHSSKGLGGPQPAEVKRMLLAEANRLAEDRAWAKERQAKLDEARSRLDAAFRQLMP